MKQFLRKIIPENIIKLYHDLKISRNVRVNKGEIVECPICESTFKIFATYGASKRSNARCHKCGSLERHRLLYKYLIAKSDLFDHSKEFKLLHFAPEKTFYSIFSQQKNLNYIPCDLSPENYKYDKKALIKKVDITEIPFDDNYFDVILCNHVLEHIPDDRKAMAELYRVMKEDGWGVFQVPIDYSRIETYEDSTIITPEARKIAFGQKDHVRWYGQDYKERLLNIGFNVIEDNYIQSFSQEEIFKYGLSSNEIIHLCKK